MWSLPGPVYGVACRSCSLRCQWLPLRQVNTDNVGGVLLREHGCQYWVSIKCFPDHTVTFRFNNGEGTAPSGMDICIGENGFGRMRVDSELQQLNQGRDLVRYCSIAGVQHGRARKYCAALDSLEQDAVWSRLRLSWKAGGESRTQIDAGMNGHIRPPGGYKLLQASDLSAS